MGGWGTHDILTIAFIIGKYFPPAASDFPVIIFVH